MKVMKGLQEGLRCSSAILLINKIMANKVFLNYRNPK